MGVSRMADLVGLDVWRFASEPFRRWGDRSYRSTLLQEMVDRKRYGQKSGAGFYRYNELNEPLTDYSGLEDILEIYRKNNIQFNY